MTDYLAAEVFVAYSADSSAAAVARMVAALTELAAAMSVASVGIVAAATVVFAVAVAAPAIDYKPALTAVA